MVLERIRWAYGFTAMCAMVGLLVYTVSYRVHLDDHTSIAVPVQRTLQKPTTKNTNQVAFVETQSEIQEARLQRMKEVCTLQSSFKESKYYRQYNDNYKFSSVYNFSVCSVPKAGSTVWKQILFTLEHGKEKASDIFSTDRFSIQRSRSFAGIRGHVVHTIPTVLVSRDPFSRLFSAFIDKFYFLGRSFSGARTRGGRNGCDVPTSFQEFLTAAVDEFISGESVNKHWAPIYSLCRPCKGNVAVLLKQETFATDIEYILNVFHVESKKKEEILEALHDKRIEYTIPGLVSTVFSHASKSRKLKCIGARGVAKRAWTSFQIQGYIRDTLSFPENADEASLSNESYVTEMIMRATAEHPMSEVEQKAQRRTALVNAYREVSDKTVEQIRQIYKIDFDLFGYEQARPSK